MSNVNYSKISTEAANAEPAKTSTPEPKIVDDPVIAPVTSEFPEPLDLPEGVVTGCTKLNVRAEPNLDAKVVRVIEKGRSVHIDLDESTDEWYAVYVGEEEGFCMKKFITID